MCRLTVVLSSKLLDQNSIKQLLWFGPNSIFKQSYSMPYTPHDEDNPFNHKINLDGYGVGYYHHGVPFIHKDVIMSWNDYNFLQLTRIMQTRLLLVHVRATGRLQDSEKIGCSPVHRYNCHPFSHQKWMFAHNGYLDSWCCGAGRKKIMNEIDDQLLVQIKGTTDTEHLFYLIMTYLERMDDDTDGSVKKAVWEAVNFVSGLAGDKMTIINCVLTDGVRLFGLRYINQTGKFPPSLYIKTGQQTIISSEPIDKEDGWELIPPNKIVTVTYVG